MMKKYFIGLILSITGILISLSGGAVFLAVSINNGTGAYQILSILLILGGWQLCFFSIKKYISEQAAIILGILWGVVIVSLSIFMIYIVNINTFFVLKDLIFWIFWFMYGGLISMINILKMHSKK